MHPGKMLTLLSNTIVKEYRNKLLIFFSLLTLLIIAIIYFVYEYLASNEQMQMAMGSIMGSELRVLYYIISMWSGFLAAVFGVNAIQSDRDFKVLGQILSFPLKRWEYLLARLVGAWVIIILYYIFSLTSALIIFNIAGRDLSFDMSILSALSITSLGIFVYLVIAMFFSMITPKIVAGILTLITGFLIQTSNNSFFGESLSNIFSDLTTWKGVKIFYHYAFPRIGVIFKWSDSFFQDITGIAQPMLEMTHFSALTLLWFGILYLVFRTREI